MIFYGIRYTQHLKHHNRPTEQDVISQVQGFSYDEAFAFMLRYVSANDRLQDDLRELENECVLREGPFSSVLTISTCKQIHNIALQTWHTSVPCRHNFMNLKRFRIQL